MPTTTIQPLPYPGPGDSPDVPRDLKALAEAVEDRGIMRFASIAARDAAIPAGRRVPGMHVYIHSENSVYVWNGGAWLRVFQPGSVSVLSTTPFYITASRSGNTVTVTALQAGPGTITGNVVVLLEAGAMPAEYRPAPAGTCFGAGQGDQPGVATLPVTLRVDVGGDILLVKPYNVTEFIQASATYLAS